MSEVTVVCCYNNLEVYNNFVNSLKSQSCSYELIGIDNRDNKAFKSCAKAYNSVKDKLTTKYVIYSHQDILLTEPDILAKFVAYLNKIEVDDILGVAGAKPGIIGYYSNIKHFTKSGSTVDTGWHSIEGGMMECDKVDECFFGGYSEHFRQYPFDENICRSWHLYAVEACLHTKSKGHKVYICDIPLIHLSSGNITMTFYIERYRLCMKYSGDFPVIAATTGKIRTGFVSAFVGTVNSRIITWIMPPIKSFLRFIGLFDMLKYLIKYKLLR